MIWILIITVIITTTISINRNTINTHNKLCILYVMVYTQYDRGSCKCTRVGSEVTSGRSISPDFRHSCCRLSPEHRISAPSKRGYDPSTNCHHKNCHLHKFKQCHLFEGISPSTNVTTTHLQYDGTCCDTVCIVGWCDTARHGITACGMIYVILTTTLHMVWLYNWCQWYLSWHYYYQYGIPI